MASLVWRSRVIVIPKFYFQQGKTNPQTTTDHAWRRVCLFTQIESRFKDLAGSALSLKRACKNCRLRSEKDGDSHVLTYSRAHFAKPFTIIIEVYRSRMDLWISK